MPALVSFIEAQAEGVEAISTRIGAALSGAHSATQAYVNGDFDMIADYQDTAVSDAFGSRLR